MEYCNLTDQESKISVTKTFNERQENSEGQFNKHRNKINEQKEFFTKEIEIIKNLDKCI